MALVAIRAENNLHTALFLKILQSVREETLNTCLCVCVCVCVRARARAFVRACVCQCSSLGIKCSAVCARFLVIVVQAVGSYTE